MVELVRDRLKTLQVGNVGIELNEASKNAYLNLSPKEMKSAIAIGDLLQKTRTFNGSTIPNAGAISNETLMDDTVTTIQPDVGQSWNVSCIKIQNLDPSNASSFTLSLYDGTSSFPIFSGSIAASTNKQWGLVSDSTGSFPALNLQLTNALYLRFNQSGAAPVQVSAAYTMDVI